MIYLVTSFVYKCLSIIETLNNIFLNIWDFINIKKCFTTHQKQTDEPLMMKMMTNSSTTGFARQDNSAMGSPGKKTVTWTGDKLEERHEPQ